MAGGKFDQKLVPEYNGTTSVVDWLERVDLICKLSGIDKVEQGISLRLAGGTFDVYQQLSDADKTNVTRVKAALRRAFALDPCEANNQFSRRTLRLDESVDEFYAALKKLSSLFEGLPDETLKYAFMAGLPAHTQELLRASADIDRIQTESILSRARAVVNNERVAATVDRSAAEKVPLPKPTENSLYCFNCSGPNHLAKHCQFERLRLRRKPTLRWYRCQEGHVASKCPENGDRGEIWAPISPREKWKPTSSDACVHQLLVRRSICGPPSEHKTEVLTVDRKNMTSRGMTSVNLRVDKRTPVVVDMLAMDGDL